MRTLSDSSLLTYCPKKEYVVLRLARERDLLSISTRNMVKDHNLFSSFAPSQSAGTIDVPFLGTLNRNMRRAWT